VDRDSARAAQSATLPSELRSVDILGVKVHGVDLEVTLQIMERWVRGNQRDYICLANVFGVVESRHNAQLWEAYHRAGLVVADGVPIVWASRVFGEKTITRVYGPDLFLAACVRSLKTGWSHYFYGGAPGVAERLAAQLTNRFPGLRIAGWSAPPFRQLTTAEKEEAIRTINDSRADILWIGLGAPRQEIWMAEQRSALSPSVAVAVGAAFDFLSGAKPEAPRWMQRIGLGWLFRFLTEPRRLWRRYLIGNSMYLFLIGKQIISRWRKRPVPGG
jgi:N-acetylglucosaminyldiphosphoundecaprenol N-acetyl-beta-D-mannosaminyltransferase